MAMEYFAGRVFKTIHQNSEALQAAEYDGCEFKGCDLSNADLRQFQFAECTFIDCNLSNANITNTAFRNCQFTACKMLGLAFYSCHPFLFQIKTNNCELSHASFYKMNIKQSVFANSVMRNIDFTECNASECIFNECDLTDAQFVQTNLTKANLVNAFNFSIDPTLNTLNQTRFSKTNILGLVQHLGIQIE